MCDIDGQEQRAFSLVAKKPAKTAALPIREHGFHTQIWLSTHWSCSRNKATMTPATRSLPPKGNSSTDAQAQSSELETQRRGALTMYPSFSLGIHMPWNKQILFKNRQENN